MTRTTHNRFQFRDIGRAISWHRRKLAVLAAVLAVLTGINAALPPDPPSVDVVRSTTRLEGGSVVTPDDLRVDRVPEGSVPEGALSDPAALIGKTLTAAVPNGQVLTPLDVVASRSGRAGRVVAPLRLDDADLVALLDIGASVDVIAADPQAHRATLVARNIRIVAKPKPPDDSADGATTGALVLVDVDDKTAILLAQAAATATLSVVMR